MRLSFRPGVRVLFGVFGLIAAISLALVVIVPLQMATQSLSTEATHQVAQTSSISATSIAQQIESLRGLTDAFAARPELASYTPETVSDAENPVRRTLAELQRANPSIKSAGILDATGKAVAVQPWSTNSLGKDFSYRDYYTGAMEAPERSYVSQTFLSVAESQPKLVSISRAVVSPSSDGKSSAVTGVLIISFDVTLTFQKYVDDFKTAHGVDVVIYDHNDNVLAKPGASKEVVKVEDVRVGNARRGMAWSGQIDERDAQVVAAYMPVSGTGWVVSASMQSKQAFNSVNRLRDSVMPIAGVLALIMAMALVFLARSMRAREKAEHDLARSEQRTRQVIESAAQAYFETDQDGRITDWNRKAEELFGWTRDETVGKLATEVIVPGEKIEDALSFYNDLDDMAPDTPWSLNIEQDLLCKNEPRKVPVELTLWTTEVDGAIRVNAFAKDITQRKKMADEQELIVKRQRKLVDELRAADQVKSDFISTISHELRTPLTSIVGYLEMLHDGYGGELSDRQTSMLDVIDRNSRRLLSLIEDVLTLSRIESGAFKVTNVQIDVAFLITGAVQALIPSARTNNLELDVDVAADTGLVNGDPNQLERALLNIMSNAIKFTPEGGRVSIHAYRDGDTVHLSVADSGIGIPVEEQNRLFSRFFRASTAQNRAIQGTGLGLTIVKSIIEKHGGSVSLQSAPDAGTTVYINLPSVGAPALSGVS